MNLQRTVFARLYRRAPSVESLQAYDETHFDVPFPMGRMRAGVYWFSRPQG